MATTRGFFVVDSDFCSLFDPFTGVVLSVGAAYAAEDLIRSNKENCDGLRHVMDVRKFLPWDQRPENGKEEESVMNTFITLTTIIAINLLQREQHERFVIHCRNGRSRSPSVVAEFFILFRGYEDEC